MGHIISKYERAGKYKPKGSAPRYVPKSKPKRPSKPKKPSKPSKPKKPSKSTRLTSQQQLKKEWQKKLDEGKKVPESVKIVFGLKESAKKAIPVSKKFLEKVKAEQRAGEMAKARQEAAILEAKAKREKEERELSLAEYTKLRQQIKKEEKVKAKEKLYEEMRRKARRDVAKTAKRREEAALYGTTAEQKQLEAEHRKLEEELRKIEEEARLAEEQARLAEEARITRVREEKERRHARAPQFRERLFRKSTRLMPTSITPMGLSKPERVIGKQIGRRVAQGKGIFGLEFVGKEKIKEFEERIRRLLSR